MYNTETVKKTSLKEILSLYETYLIVIKSTVDMHSVVSF